MHIIEQSANIWGEVPYEREACLAHIEKAGRTCYNSIDKITPTSAPKFVGAIANKGHLSVIEHSNIVLVSGYVKNPQLYKDAISLLLPSDHITTLIHKGRVYIAGNYRAFFELMHLFPKLWHINSPNLANFPAEAELGGYTLVTNPADVPMQLRQVTVEFITDRAVTHELVRHRKASYSQRSQRYVRENDVGFIKPVWWDNCNKSTQDNIIAHFYTCEKAYNECLHPTTSSDKLIAEQARILLPNAAATNIVMTTTIPQWWFIFGLRTSKAAYPQIRELLSPVQQQFIHNGWVL